MTSTNWTLIFSPPFQKALEKLDRGTKITVLRYIETRLETTEDPRCFGKSLTGNLEDFWCYRVGDYRIICEIKDSQLHILFLTVDHRRAVYKKNHRLRPSA